MYIGANFFNNGPHSTSLLVKYIFFAVISMGISSNSASASHLKSVPYFVIYSIINGGLYDIKDEQKLCIDYFEVKIRRSPIFSDESFHAKPCPG